MKQQRIEFVMTAEARDQIVQFLGEIPGKYCIPLLNIMNTMEQRVVPTPRGVEGTDGGE